MSNESRRCARMRCPSAAVAIAPLAGPLSTIAAGFVHTWPAAAKPPSLRIT
jgi:hypothetical protein